MDSVIGRIGGKVLLTMNFNNCGSDARLPARRKHPQSVIDVFMSRAAGNAGLQETVPVSSDNGTGVPTQALETSQSEMCCHSDFLLHPNASGRSRTWKTTIATCVNLPEELDKYTQEMLTRPVPHHALARKASTTGRPQFRAPGKSWKMGILWCGK